MAGYNGRLLFGSRDFYSQAWRCSRKQQGAWPCTETRMMDTVILLLVAAIALHFVRARYQRGRIILLGRHLSSFQLERHMETLTEGYTRAIGEQDPSRQLQVLEMFAQTENAVATQIQSLADLLQKEPAENTRVGMLPFCVPYAERIASYCRFMLPGCVIWWTTPNSWTQKAGPFICPPSYTCFNTAATGSANPEQWQMHACWHAIR
jgi:hypothetical protein